ncbi:unnamed protein product [Dicrocoelium dendriticum]|nr:unnamed protein product [Dicrocoelium dendriticum]
MNTNLQCASEPSSRRKTIVEILWREILARILEIVRFPVMRNRTPCGFRDSYTMTVETRINEGIFIICTFCSAEKENQHLLFLATRFI